ncbi:MULTISPECIES: PspC domain-containing protein [Nocardia]|uniref:PspC domain-containing protein n=1 Tax=Nocardia TaxID=1817 RepID=UPI000D693466|nr:MULTISPECIES: PspC domain-containing protein [Nocardia]
MTKTSFGDQLQQMWQSRPVRLPRQGPVAGVAAGFGRRYQVDPVLVRVAFVVSALFGGAGIVLYLVGWLLFSQAGDQTSAAESLFGKGHSSQSPTKTIVLMVALAIAVSTMGPVGMGMAGSGVISLALMLAGWWMLFMRTPQPPPGTSQLDDYEFDAGLSATGYPGAVFPSGTTGSFYAPEAPMTGMYTPYTKLPEAYVPEAPAAYDPATAQRADDSAVRLDKAETGENRTGVTVEHEGEADRPEVRDATGHDGETDGDVPGRHLEVDNATVRLDKSSPGIDARSNAPAENPAVVAPSGESTDGTATADRRPTPIAAATPAGIPRPGSPRTLTPGPRTIIGGPVPPSWDPLGVAPLAWDLPDPTPANKVVAPAPRRPRSRLTPVVIGLAILAAAGAGAAAASGVEWMTPARIGAVALAVVGLGLVLGAFLRRGYGLLVVTAPLAAFVLLASLVGPMEFDRATMGDRTWAPTATADLKPEYHLSMGSGTLDLRGLDLTENRTVDLSVQMGEARVLVPAGMTVRTECTVAMGDQSCPTGVTGPNTPGAPVLDLNVDVRMGEVVVERG